VNINNRKIEKNVNTAGQDNFYGMVKQGYVVGYAMLEGSQKMSLKDISVKTRVLSST